MKQLKKFIGVYILALCATNAALGAMYGSYDATCTKDTDITIKNIWSRYNRLWEV